MPQLAAKTDLNLGNKIYRISIDTSSQIVRIEVYQPKPNCQHLLLVFSNTLYGENEIGVAPKRWCGNELRREITASHLLPWMREKAVPLMELMFADSHNNIASLVAIKLGELLPHILKGMKIKLLENDLIKD